MLKNLSIIPIGKSSQEFYYFKSKWILYQTDLFIFFILDI